MQEKALIKEDEMSYTKRIQIVALFSLFIAVLIFGCSKKERGGQQVLARINGYELTVSDYKEAVDPLLMKKYASYSPIRDKEQILETLISKEVLLQEAQRENLDKEKAFMKEIEGYWEQALLKSLINKRLKELSLNIIVTDKEVLDGYNRLKRRVQAELDIFADKAQTAKLSSIPADWYIHGDLPSQLENIAFSLKAGESSPPVEYNDAWVVVKVLKEEELKIKPLEEIQWKIKEDVVRIKKQELLEKWSADLRKKAKVEINRDLLTKVDQK